MWSLNNSNGQMAQKAHTSPFQKSPSECCGTRRADWPGQSQAPPHPCDEGQVCSSKLRVYSKASRLTGKILKSFWNLLRWTSNLFSLGNVLGRTSGHTQSARLQTHKSFWELRGLGLSQGGSNVWPLLCPSKIQLTAVNILAKVLSPFFCQFSSTRKQRESKTTAWPDFCKRMLLSLKGGTCQHLDNEHMANSHLCL